MKLRREKKWGEERGKGREEGGDWGMDEIWMYKVLRWENIL